MDRFRDFLTALQAGGFSGLLREPRGLFALGAVAVLVVYGLSVGKTRALMSLLAIYVAYTLTLLFPFQDAVVGRLPDAWQVYASAVLFVGLYVVVFFVLSHTLRKSRVAMGEISVAAVVLISVVQVGLLAAMLASFVPIEVAGRAAGGLGTVLAGRYALWAWAAGSLLILPFVRARGHHS